jgi:hypothetical protein
MVREVEEVVKGQLKAIEELDDKGESMIRLAVITLVFGLTLGSLIGTNYADEGRSSVMAIVFTAAGFLAALVSLYMLVHSYASLTGERDAAGNPDPNDLPRRHKTPGMDLEIHLEGLLDGYVPAYNQNRELMQMMTRWRRRGTKVLAYVAIPLYLMGMVLVVVLAMA